MAEAKHIAILRSGIDKWNAWRRVNPDIRPDLRGVDLDEADLREVNLREANLSWANLSKADLSKADLRGANLYDANLGGANLSRADLREADLSRAYLRGTYLAGTYLDQAYLIGADLWDAQLTGAQLRGADLTLADLDRAHLYGANLYEANLTEADLTEADLSRANLHSANLSRADLTRAILTEASFINATLDGCRVYGISAWDVQLEDAIQTNLRITPDNEPDITVDSLEIGQFLYLLLHSEKARQVIDSLTSKVVLIIGRLTSERKAALGVLRDALRQRSYVPVLCDLDGSSERNGTEMVLRLARTARFIIADTPDPADAPQELRAIMPRIQVPVLPIIAEGAPSDLVFAAYQELPWVLGPVRYPQLQDLVVSIDDSIIAPAEARVRDLMTSYQPEAEAEVLAEASAESVAAAVEGAAGEIVREAAGEAAVEAVCEDEGDALTEVVDEEEDNEADDNAVGEA